MKTYEVEMLAQVWVNITVNAEDEESAKEEAYKVLEDEDYEVDFEVTGVTEQ